MKSKTPYRRMMIVILCAAVVLMILPSAASAQNDNPGVLLPNSKPFGAMYGDWGGKWWQWALGQPTDVNPLLDTTGEYCAEGQSGPVWFLAGTLFNVYDPGGITRHCTIPTGKHLFFPVLNAGWVTWNSDEELCTETDAYGRQYASLDECAREASKNLQDWSMTQAVEVLVTVDGVPVDLNITDEVVSPYRVVPSDFFELLMPEDNVWGSTAETCPVVDGKLDCSPGYSDGIYLMLAPLSAGEHTIHVLAAPLLNVTYELTVQGGRSAKGGAKITVVGADGPHEISLDNSLFLPFVGRAPLEQP